MAYGDAGEEKWRGNWRMEWVASTLHTTSEHGVSSITTADAHTSAASSRMKWRPCRFKWTRPFRRKTKSGFCVRAITFQTQSTAEILCFETDIFGREIWVSAARTSNCIDPPSANNVPPNRTESHNKLMWIYTYKEKLMVRKLVKSCPVCVAMFPGTSYSDCLQQLQFALRAWWWRRWWWWWWWPSSHIPSCSSMNITFKVASIYSVPSPSSS